MGGRRSCTNGRGSRVSIIADISLDHQNVRGKTRAEIAPEKVGIIRPGGVVVTLPQQPEANDVIGNTILDLGAHGVSAVPYVPPVSPGSGDYLVPSEENVGGDHPEEILTARDAENRSPGRFYRYPLQV